MASILRQTTARNLLDQLTIQQLFDSNATGALSLVPGTYFFDFEFALTAMSATSGNAAFDILGAGTATTSKFLWQVVGYDSPGIGVQNTTIGGIFNVKNSAASLITAGTNTTLLVTGNGSFEVTVGGTIIPSITLVTGGVTPQVEVGSFINVTRIGEAGLGQFVDGFRTTISTVIVAGVSITTTYSDGTVRIDKL